VDMGTIGVADRPRLPRTSKFDEVEDRLAASVSAITAIGADIETGGATP
jgi:hypothetical protein